ncbi:dihydroxyacetone kinase subunit DhaL [Oceanivirga salmonicida]|uniref:dihydroxyacetone kinase subunit DhaL n=1 Tax=Oceanivirga salmonicida TaxID=1769291 RepID=UPI000829E647|nr:dihydroxyacetone kinase subunit DhaL [Oceanivirga salmonicida]
MEVLKIIDKICDNLIEKADLLTELDRKIGDGDHGINVKRGFSEIKKALPTYESKSTKEIFNSCAMILMTKVGGSSGPLFATAFMRAATKENFVDMLAAATEGIEARGKAKVGEKTMVDILRPASDTLNGLINDGKDLKTAMLEVVTEAKINLENTKDIVATKGRASYLGERSLGTIDPGAYSTYIILETIAGEL